MIIFPGRLWSRKLIRPPRVLTPVFRVRRVPASTFNLYNEHTTSDTTRKRKRKSRWGEKPAEVAAATTPATPTKPVIAMINGVPVVVPTVVSALL